MLTVTYSEETIKTVDRALRFRQPGVPLSTSRPILVQQADPAFCPETADGKHAWYESPYTGGVICASCSVVAN